MKQHYDFSKVLQVFTRIDESLGKRHILRAIRSGLTYMIPLLMIGSFALIALSLPIPAYQNMMKSLFGSQWGDIFLYARDGTFNIFSLLMVVCISYSYTIESQNRYLALNPIITSSIALCSFIVISGISKDGFVIAKFGVTGVFLAMLIALTSSMLFLKLSSYKFLRLKVLTDGASASYSYAISAILPAAITVATFSIVNIGLTYLLSISDVQNFLSDFFVGMFVKMGSTFMTGILFMLMVHLFWFFGMHGSNILEPVAQKVFVSALEKNQALAQVGIVPTEIYTKTFFDTFVLMGGCGATLCLVAAIFIWGRHKNQRRLAKMSFLPVFFNINELIVFGIPIVLNPLFIIPFIVVPVILTTVSYLAMQLGLIPCTQNLVEWTTPIFLSGYVATGSIRGSILQLVNLVIGTLCYIPFIKLSENISAIKMKNNLDKVYTTFKEREGYSMMTSLLSRQDDIGGIARSLATDLDYDIDHEKLQLFYQPQVDFNERIVGLEALLRWKHDDYHYISPPLIIAMAEENQLIEKLGYWILDTACRDLKRIHMEIDESIEVSVNVSALQLEDSSFADKLSEILQKHDSDPGKFKIEITEQLALVSSRKIVDQIMAIKTMGVKLAMDDFGMGHSSLLYLKEYDFDSIKLDGSLVKEILTNSNCKNIVSTIVSLGKSLNYTVIAEYVETDAQRQILHELGCTQYQGYLFCKAIPLDEAMSFIITTRNH